MVQTDFAPQEINIQEIDAQEVQKVNEIVANTEAYKERLKQLPEVQALTNEISVQDVNTIVSFGQKSAEEITKISDKILSIAKVPTSKDAAQMITQLAKIMDKFDIRELEKIQSEPEKQGLLQKLKQKIKDEFEALVSKYDDMSKEVDKISQLLRTYENQTKQDNVTLTEMCQANYNYFEQLERYVVAAELGLGEIANYRQQVANRTDISEDQKNAQLQQLDMMSQMLDQRKYDLLQAEVVARMTVPMLQNMQLTNVNLLREINTAFVVGLPIFKQNLAQAIMLKRQAITANSMEQFKGAINKQLEQNATYASVQGKLVAENVTKGTFDMETLRKVYSTIKTGTENTKRIMSEQESKNKENTKDLEQLKADIQSGSLNTLQAPSGS
jgi:toxic anion resistance family protein